MTFTDGLKILDDKNKASQAQYDLDREAAKISLDKYEYLAGEDMRYKPGVVGKGKFEYFSLGNALNNAKIKTNKRDKVVSIEKYVKNLFYNAHHSFIKFKNISDFKELSLDSMFKKLSNFCKKINEFKNFVPQKKGNEDLKPKVLDSAGEIVLFSVYRIIFTRKNITKKKMI